MAPADRFVVECIGNFNVMLERIREKQSFEMCIDICVAAKYFITNWMSTYKTNLCFLISYASEFRGANFTSYDDELNIKN